MSFVVHERERLINTIREAGPDAPTLCEGWSVRDLLVHLIIREQKPHLMFGQSLPGVIGKTAEHKIADLADSSFNELLDTFDKRSKFSPLKLTAFDSAINTLEYTIHHEDVRRANNFPRRHLHAGDSRAVFRSLRVMSQTLMGHSPVHVILEAPGLGHIDILPTRKKMKVVKILGEPLELALFAFGREDSACVNLLGDPDDVESLRKTKRSI